MSNLLDRVADEARKFRPLAVLLWLLSAPFYVLGLLVGALWVVGSYAVAAVKVGIADARARKDGGT